MSILDSVVTNVNQVCSEPPFIVGGASVNFF